MATDPLPVIVSPPKLIGTDTVAVTLNLSISRVRRLITARDGRVIPGYLGKFGRRHIWNAHELFAGLYSTPQALWEEIGRVETGRTLATWCGVPDCDEPAHFLQLCDRHLNRLLAVWRRAERSSLVVWRLLALCTWVVERNSHLVPPAGWDPWSNVCMTPGCDNRTDTAPARTSPLCVTCTAEFWDDIYRPVARCGTLRVSDRTQEEHDERPGNGSGDR